MKRKTIARHPRIPRNKPSVTFSLVVLAVFFTAFLGLVTVARLYAGVHVLGAHTVLLAKENESNHEQSTQNVTTIAVEPTKTQEFHDSPPTEKITEAPVHNETLVDCEGTEGKHLTVSLEVCKRIHEEMKSKKFSFTPLPKLSEKTTEKKHGEETSNTHASTPSAKRKEPEIKTEQIKNIIEKQKEKESHVEDNQSSEKKDGVFIERDGNNIATLTEKNSRASSDLPIAIDPKTKGVTVTTASGDHEIHIFPDKAVESILQAKLLTSTETEISSASGESTKKVTLTQVNNQPAFAVNGVSEKKILGFFPVAFSKTIFISAVDGTVMKTDQSVLNSLLEKLSF